MKKISQANIIKFSIIFGVVLIFTVLVLIVTSGNTEKKVIKTGEEKIKENFNLVEDYHLYFFISKNINNFIKEEKEEKIINLLDPKYITKNNIDVNNVKDNIKYSNSEYEYKIKKLYNYEFNNYVTIYYVTGNVYETYLSKIVATNVGYLVLIDYSNLTYSVIPSSYSEATKYMDDLDGNYGVEKNGQNAFEGVNMIDSNQMCMIYLSDYIMLDNDKKLEITNNIDNEKELNKYTFNSVVKYCTYDKNSSTYVIVDGNNNKYNIYENYIMDYNVTINN